MKETLQYLLVIGNVGTIIFFFGFHFSQFKTLVADVVSIRSTVENIDGKSTKNAIDIARMEGRAGRMG